VRLIYLANIRLPTERAHGVQIVQNCEAFAAAGADLSLWIARRAPAPELRGVGDVWAHYGVAPNFRIRRLPCLDLLAWVPGRTDIWAKIAFGIESLTFALAALVAALFTPADIYYSRDPLVLALLAIFKPRRRLAYEAHMLAQGRIGRGLQGWVLRHVERVFTTTRHLADDLIARGADAERVQVAHDGVRRARFDPLPTQSEARLAVGWSGVIVGYVGRLQAVGFDKGAGVLVEALAPLAGISLGLVGGPDEAAEGLRARWRAVRGSDDGFLYAGQVAPEQVPIYLSACDICAIPSPENTFFAYHSSPMKLFEYMAAGKPILASDLPALREVVRDGESALLLPPADVGAWTAAILRLLADDDLRGRLAANAQALVWAHYTWDARAHSILATLAHHDP